MKIYPASLRYALGVGLLAVALAGCKSDHDKQIDRAKELAAQSGQPQTVTWLDKNGNTITTTIQPPGPGQGIKDEVVTTTTTPAAPGTTGGSNSATAGPNSAGPGMDSGRNENHGGGSGTMGAGSGSMGSAQQAPPPPIHVTAGTTLTIRVDQAISMKSAHIGDPFTGEIVSPVQDSAGATVIPKGAPVEGRVDAAKARGHFKGAGTLELRLTALTLNGTKYPLDTQDVSESAKGKGKRTAVMVGGGAGLGMLIGGLAGGGKGALIGGLLGAGAGTAGAGLTGNKDIVIPAESVVNFTLADDLVLQP